MTNRIKILLVLLLAGTSAQAQVVFNSIDEIWKYADQHNITIRTVKYELDKSVYAKKQSYSTMLPQVNATGSYTDNVALQTTLIPAIIAGGAPGTYRTLQFGQQFVYTGGINAQISILNLQNWYNVQIARETEAMNRDSLGSTRKQVYQQLATQFYSYLLMQEAARIAKISAQVADSVLQSVTHKYEQGTVNDANVAVAKINKERALQTALSSNYQMEIANNNLKSLLGFGVNDAITINASLQKSMLTEEGKPYSEDPAVRVAEWRTKLSLAQYHTANSAFLPTINILYNYATQRSDKVFQPLEGASGVAGWFPSQYWSLQASWPLFTSGNRWYQSRKMKLGYEQSAAQLEYVRKQSAINDENIKLNYMKASVVLSKSENIMQLSATNYQHVNNRYEAGIASIDERLNAFKDYLDYQNQYLNSLSDLLVQLYQVKIRQQSF